MADQFSNVADQVSAPATRAVAVTPHDADPLADIPKALYIGTGGSIAMRGVGAAGDARWVNVPSGSLLPFRAQYVCATGTTASDILALY